MSQYIGPVEVDAITSVEVAQDRSQEEIDFGEREDSVLFIQDSDLEDLTINVALITDNTKNQDEKREELKELLETPPKYTSFVYERWKGFLSVDNVSFPRSPTGNIRFASIDARYLDWPEYYPDNEPPEDGDYGFGTYNDGEYGS